MGRLRKLLSKIPIMRKIYSSFITLLRKSVGQISWLEVQNIEKELQRRALKETVDYVEANMANVKSFIDKYELLDAALGAVSMNNGLFLEFGVWRGDTVNYVASRTECHIYGFDSFEGLPEDWRDGIERGYFSISAPPKVKSNVTLIKGWFNESLPGFLCEHKEVVAFIHFDCDLYSSTKDIFCFAGDRIVEGTILVFDEYFNYSGWRNGEFKAFQEFCLKNGIQYEYIGYCRYHEQVAVKIIKRKCGFQGALSSD